MVPVTSSMQTNAKSQLDINVQTVRVIPVYGMIANNLDWFGANQVNTPSIPFPHLRIMIHTTTVS